jgi:hypothetical protein
MPRINSQESIQKRKETIQKKRDKKEALKKSNEINGILKAGYAHAEVKKTANNILVSHIKGDIKKPLLNTINQLGKKYSDKLKVIQTSTRYKGHDILEIIVKEKTKAKDIEKLVSKMSKSLQKQGVKGSLQVSMRDNTWDYGGSSSIGSTFSIDPLYFRSGASNTLATYDQFAVFFVDYPEAAMGASPDGLNNCFYECLIKLNVKMPWTTAYDMKKQLKLPCWAKIHLEHIPAIEKMLKTYRINITGDYCYTSQIKSHKEINLKIVNEHCTVDYSKKKDIFRLWKKISFEKEKKPIIYEYLNTFMGYDGEKEFYIDKEFRNACYDHQTEYILIDRDLEYPTMKEQYDHFILMAKELKKETAGKINLFKTGNFKMTALNLFDRYTKCINNPPIIKQVEADIINKASQGAIIFTEKYEGMVHEADIKSMYPSILKSNMCFPIDEGELLFLDELPSILKYGLYKVKIEMKNDFSKVFRNNYDNWYTHTDINHARELGLYIELIDDKQPNFLYYSRDKLITGHELFGDYVDTLFNLKEKNINGSKSILNILYGALCQKNKKVKEVRHNEQYNIPDECDFKIKPSNFNEEQNVIKEYKRDMQYKTPYARILPFILAKGRSIIGKIILPIKDDVLRCHTDGIYFKHDTDLSKLKFGDALGDLVYKGLHNINIINCNNIIIND